MISTIPVGEVKVLERICHTITKQIEEIEIHDEQLSELCDFVCSQLPVDALRTKVRGHKQVLSKKLADLIVELKGMHPEQKKQAARS